MSKYTLKIITDLEKLHERVDEINLVDEQKVAKRIVKELKDTLKANKDLVALAAPQLGYNYRIFCIKFADNKIQAFINPMISKTEGLHLTREACPSITAKEFIVPRYDRIITIYQELPLKNQSNKFEGPAAEVFQQMINMLDGILINDFGLEVFPEFDKASKEEQDEVINWYIDQLKATNENFQQEIENDKELKQFKDATDFMTKVALGEITIEPVEQKESGEVQPEVTPDANAN